MMSLFPELGDTIKSRSNTKNISVRFWHYGFDDKLTNKYVIGLAFGSSKY